MRDYSRPEYFINRELSWLEFNERVLEEAKDKNNPLLERIKFLAITSSNLDEFFMIRVASIKDQVSAGFNKPDASGLTPKEQLKKISLRTHKMVEAQYNTYNRSLIPALKKNGIHILYQEDLTQEQEQKVEDYFNEVVYPVLTPMAVDSSRPFPLILNKSLNIGVLIKHKDIEKDFIFATVQVPSVLPRLVQLSGEGEGNTYFILMEEVIMMYLDRLFAGHKVISASPYRIMRNADLTIEEEEAEDLLVEIERSLKQRKWGVAIRLEVESSVDERLIHILKEDLEIHHGDIYDINGPLDLNFLMKLCSAEGYDELKYPPHTPQTPQDLLGEEDIFKAIQEKDIFLHHPYESFNVVVDFIKKAAEDPNVLAIKQTLYRVSGNSPIVRALAEAAERGKQVMALVEVKARFDEENNIQWAKKLEQAGCHVIYGLVGLKTHSKITLVVRKEEDGIRRYVHLGTGNYNDITAKFYTDMGILTCNEYFGADASAVFNMLSGYSDPPQWHKLEAAPIGLRKKFLDMIKGEAKNALSGKKAVIIAKMNSLVDTEIISALYQAASAGVKIELIVRGICSLQPGLQGISENITVRSIVGRFLEHSRIYYFYNGGREDLFLSSADWMPRNLDRRVELLFPIEDKGIKLRIMDILDYMLEDTVKARIMCEGGIFKRIDKRGKKIFDMQDYFCNLARQNIKSYNSEANAISIDPILSSQAVDERE